MDEKKILLKCGIKHPNEMIYLDDSLIDAREVKSLLKPGGMLRLAIPLHRLPEAVLARDLARVMSLGIDLQCNVYVDAEKLERFLAEFQAVFYAVGAHQSRRLEIPGADSPQVLAGLPFLKMVRNGRLEKLSGRTVVIGGGNVAIDVAMTARRLGADHVDIVSLEQHNALPAHAGDVLDARQEDISFHHGWGPGEIGTGWKIAENMAPKVSTLAVETNIFPLYEIIDGLQYHLTYHSKGLPVEEYLTVQGRYAHLTPE